MQYTKENIKREKKESIIMNEELKKQLLEATDELWYKFFRKTPNYYDMTEIKPIDKKIKLALQDWHIKTRHWINFIR